MALREKYDYAIQTAKNLRFDGSAQEQDGKLHFKGTVNSQDEANKIWDAIKTIPDWQKEVQADIKVNPAAAPKATGTTGTTSQAAGKTYTVKAGDTLSKIAKEDLGDANAYQDIFNANRDQLTDPDQIKPGQVLKIPGGKVDGSPLRSKERTMDWLNQIRDVMDKYGTGDPPDLPGSVDDDFDQFSRNAPPSTVSEGLAEAFRSRQTPPFATMLSQLFNRSPSSQKTSVLSTLVATLGPALVSQLLARHGANRAAQELQSNVSVSPEVAEQIPSTSIEAVAAEAEKKDPSIVDRISKFYADQPALVKTLGGLALTVAMAKVAQRQTQPRR